MQLSRLRDSSLMGRFGLPAGRFPRVAKYNHSWKNISIYKI